MDSHELAVTDEMKRFLQEGLQNYAPALIALSEFRRQVRTRLQIVLDEYETQFGRLGLSVTGWKSYDPKLDDTDLSENSSWVGLTKTHGGELYSGCSVEWDFTEPKDGQVWVDIWLYAGKTRADRNRFFGALQKERSAESKAVLGQLSGGTARLYRLCDADQFYTFEGTFRTLIEEWVGLLSAVGGIRQFVSVAGLTAEQDSDGT